MKYRFYFDEFLLSHHNPDEYYRCYKIKLFKNKYYHICSRCLGLYSIALISFIFYLNFNTTQTTNLLILYLAPIPAFIDWGLYLFKINKGKNYLRTITGGLLGLTYSKIIYNILFNHTDINTYISLILFLTLAMIMLIISIKYFKK